MGGLPVGELGAVDAGAVELLDRARAARPRRRRRAPTRSSAGCRSSAAGRACAGRRTAAGRRGRRSCARASPVIGKRNSRSKRIAYCTWRANAKPLALQLDGLAERGQVAAQLLQRVHPVRHPLADHERVERQVAVAVRAVVDEVPEHVGVARTAGAEASSAAASGGRLSRSSAAALALTRRKRAASRSQKIAPKWLAGRSGDGDRLREQDSALAVVAGACGRRTRPGRTSALS